MASPRVKSFVKPKTETVHTEPKHELFDSTVLPANPTSIDLTVSYSVEQMKKQKAKDKKKE